MLLFAGSFVVFDRTSNHQQKGVIRAMSNKPPVGKTLTLAYAAVAAFTAISILVPILIEKVARKEKRSAE
jgi:xanthine/uracil permease